ncbi:MAG: DUF4440 domain-containing protein [Saprospiraceae bacterium]|nr:DUF4440 domain-containing protein [Saprospiraceae bacterium]
MSRNHFLVPALILLAGCTSNINHHQSNSEVMQKQEKQHIEALLSEYQTSLNTSDAGLAQSLYTRDGVLMPSEAPTATGSEHIKKAYEFVFSQIQLNIDFFIEEIEIEQNLAFATTTSKGTTLIRATGQTVPEENRELFVFEKVGGEWKIARYMFNKMSPQK